MTEQNPHIWMVEAALFQFRSAIGSIDDEMTAGPLRLATSVLENAVAAAKNGVTAATVNDVVFAMNDVAGAVGELSGPDHDRVAPAFDLLKRDVDGLQGSVTLPEGLVDRIRALQAKLKTRRAAIERQTMVEGGTAEPLPHPPVELSGDAIPIREQLLAAGFATPALDAFIDDPSSLRFYSINAIVDELDVIAG